MIEKIVSASRQLDQPAFPVTQAGGSAGAEPAAAAKGRIAYDGLNLGLLQGTGIATYTHMLTTAAHDLGYDVDILYETPFAIPQDPILQDVLFFDQGRKRKRPPSGRSLPGRMLDSLTDRLRREWVVEPVPLRLGAAVDARQFADIVPGHCRALAAQEVFTKAGRYFNNSGKLTTLSFAERPEIFHSTYPIPLAVKGACNVVTIHDLVPLRLPQSTADDKRAMFRLLKAVLANADHVVTVSETSKRDIVALLGVDESRVTNTYQAVAFSTQDLARSDDAVANQIAGLHGLEMHDYLLFFGALEPKKNVGRLIDAYLSSGVERPLVLVTSPGWMNDGELSRLHALDARPAPASGKGPAVRRLDYLTRSNLVNLIRGARAVVFPSLLEGFGLPVLEAMTLGTPVVTSAGGALEEIAGDAALLVDPYDVDDIARAITRIGEDIDLRGELSRRGIVRADKFSQPRYRQRVEALYAALA